ncbi:unnamed protein product [Prorocentrum cordatum]|uniref:Ammonium transporter AmtB-like domain-containing protein n=1 Tax=Prorocentrum cordatum TaxID=2364126 RepID=A0ABN9TXY8_9DINO|nr:unnamed protein product [Polarella glacialis]
MALAQQDLQSLQEGLIALQQQVLALQVQATSEGGVQDTVAQSTAVWVLICAALVFFMQAGFSLVEAGTCRAKNALSILVKNQVDFLCASLAWFLFGWGAAFGDSSPTAGLIGTTEYFGEAVLNQTGVSDHALSFHFQQMFCAVAGTIVSGGIAERAELRGYILYSVCMASFIYPCIACWCWNPDGWLAALGFVDFAGSGVVHLTGGTGALVGAWVVGPRTGRFGTAGILKDRHDFSPHNVPFILVGTMILQFGWYGFNAGSIMSMETVADSRTSTLAAINTTMAAVAGGLVAVLTSFLRKRRWDVPFVCNGVLAGCVSITASCPFVSHWAALLVGGAGGVCFGLASSLLYRLHIDDPIGAFPVHGACGFWGVLAVGIFHRSSDVMGGPAQAPKFYVQLVGALAVCAFSGFMSLFLFLVMRRVGMLNSSLQDQRKGLDRNFTFEAYNSGEVKNYHAFLSHAKSTHGATARWLQLELARYARGRSSIFLDSDNLVNLNHLLATVRDKVDVLVVLATEEIWWRPWCAGEVTVASSADVPIVLVMMGASGKPLHLDFGAISRDVRKNISTEAMNTLAPFGIGYGDIEMAYNKLAKMPQVQFGLLGRREVRDAIASIARHAGLRRDPWARRTRGVAARAATSRTELGRRLSRSWMQHTNPNYVIVGDWSDLEAVAAMHICQQALQYASDQDSNFRTAVCTDMSEAKVLALVCAGATIIIVLSKGVLQCPLVRRACLVRARALWPDGFAGSCSASQTSFAVTIDADRLDFEFPGASFYEELQADRGLELRAADRASGCLPLAAFGSRAADCPRAAESTRGGEGRAAALLAAFFRLLFQQIALPMSTHGSWKAIQQQSFSVYEAAVRTPRVLADPGGCPRAESSLGRGKVKTLLQSRSSLSTSLGETLRATCSSLGEAPASASLPAASPRSSSGEGPTGSGAEADAEDEPSTLGADEACA